MIAGVIVDIDRLLPRPARGVDLVQQADKLLLGDGLLEGIQL